MSELDFINSNPGIRLGYIILRLYRGDVEIDHIVLYSRRFNIVALYYDVEHLGIKSVRKGILMHIPDTVICSIYEMNPFDFFILKIIERLYHIRVINQSLLKSKRHGITVLEYLRQLNLHMQSDLGRVIRYEDLSILQNDSWT